MDKAYQVIMKKTMDIAAEVLALISVCGCPIGWELTYAPMQGSWEIQISLKIPNLWKPGGKIKVLPHLGKLTASGPTLSAPPPVIEAIAYDSWEVVTAVHLTDVHCCNNYKEVESLIVSRVRDTITDLLREQITYAGFA